MLEDAMQRGVEPTDPMVVDNSTLKFISVNDAYYLVGSKKPATMSMVSKYAFGTKEAAEKFAKEYGGKIMRYPEVLKMVEANYDKEAAMIAKKQAIMAKKGAMIYKKKCQPIEEKFTTAAEAKAYIKAHHSCPGLKGKALQAVGLYLKSR
jgi:uncharacterized membrane protein